jgi:MYXO-CTERM domain-containing protein
MQILAPLLFALATAAAAHASPGAHGPNGEHLDGPLAATAAGSVPRVETFSELFELVGHLSGGELSVMVDRYDTNEPVLNGKLEVQYQNLKAQATFHSDIGDYAIDDEKFLQALGQPGKHALLFTFVHGEESDLLEGTLEVVAPASHEHGPTVSPWWLLAAAPLAAAAAALVRRRRRRAGGQP